MTQVATPLDVCVEAMPMLAVVIRILTKTTAADEAGRYHDPPIKLPCLC
jgi:hypothetical protein